MVSLDVVLELRPCDDSEPCNGIEGVRALRCGVMDRGVRGEGGVVAVRENQSFHAEDRARRPMMIVASRVLGTGV